MKVTETIKSMIYAEMGIDVEVEEKLMLKGRAFIIKEEGVNVAPVIYISPNWTTANLVENVISNFKISRKESFDVVAKFDINNVISVLVNESYMRNEIDENDLITFPSRIKGLIFVFRQMLKFEGSSGSFLLTREMLDIYQISESELISKAFINTYARARIENICGATVITNDIAHYGAASIMATEKLGICDGPYWVIPSSIDEVMIFPMNDFTATYNYVTSWIKNVNSTQLEPWQVLLDVPFVLDHGELYNYDEWKEV